MQKDTESVHDQSISSPGTAKQFQSAAAEKIDELHIFK